MSSSRPKRLLHNPEIERACRRNRTEQQLRRKMTDPNAVHHMQEEDGAEIDENQRVLKDTTQGSSTN